MTLLRHLVVCSTACFISVAAHATELPPLLESAVAKGEAADAVRWSFTQRVTNRNVDLTLRFEPRGASGIWQLMSPSESELDENGTEALQRFTDVEGDPDPDRDLTYEQARSALGDQVPEVIEETDTHVIYAFAPQPWDDIEEDEAPILEHMRAEVTVEKDGEYISRIRLYAPERFHHMVVARIDRFEQEMNFAPEPMTGLPLMTSFTQEIEGRALFRRFNQGRQEIYSDFVPMTDDGIAISCGPSTCPGYFSASQ